MCEVLETSRAGYYKWLNRLPSNRALINKGLTDFLLESAKKEHAIPGYRKLWRSAVNSGFICSKNRVLRLLQAAGYRSRVAPKQGYRKPRYNMPTLPNLLNREFKRKESNQVWVSDITQIRCLEGWIYIAVVLDLFSRTVVGWAASHINNSELVEMALRKAWDNRQPNGSELMFHSDQGCQYRSQQVVSWLAKKDVTISMSRRGNCWDNACAESFFAQMKKEWFKQLDTLSRIDTSIEVQYYIEEYYNTVRRHGTLQGRSPMEYEEQVTKRCLL